jgi:hypothetical protein
MRRIYAVALALGFLLLAGGCFGVRGAKNASVGAGDATSAEPKGDRAGPCLERHGFAVYGFRTIRDDYGQVSVIGEIKNTGSASQGVELQASLRDAHGRLVAVGNFCPASSRNIVPNETWPFTYSFGRQEDAIDAELRIVGSFRTADILNTPSR